MAAVKVSTVDEKNPALLHGKTVEEAGKMTCLFLLPGLCGTHGDQHEEGIHAPHQL